MTTSPAHEAPIGPYFDYPARMDWLTAKRNSYARIAAQYLNAGDVRSAKVFAGKYASIEEVTDELQVWFGEWSQTDARWVGYRAYSDARARGRA